MAVYLCPLSTFMSVFNNSGLALTNGLIWTYKAGTSTPQATYTDSTGTVPNANPIQLTVGGNLSTVNIWQPQNTPIKVQFSTNAGTVGSPVFGTQIGPTFDNIVGINDPSAVQFTFYGPTDTGSANNYIFSTSPASVAYTNGQFFYWIPANTNTGASTVNINGLGAISIVNQDGSALIGNQIQANQISVIVIQGGKAILLVTGNTQIAPLVKTATTSRASTTTLAADPDLSIVLSPGTYVYEFAINMFSNSASNGGIVLQPSLNGAVFGTMYVGFSNVNASGSVLQFGGNVGTNFAYTTLTRQVGPAFVADTFWLKGSFTIASTQTFALYWAQDSSSAGTAEIAANSTLIVTRGQVV